jgi:hypothetical protein
VRLDPDHIDERAELIAEIIPLSERTGDREVAVNALMWRVGDAPARRRRGHAADMATTHPDVKRCVNRPSAG